MASSVKGKTFADFPQLVAQWDWEKNGELRPRDLASKSGRSVWWRCSEGPDHTWLATVANRVNGTGCPACAGKQVSVTNSLATHFPEVAAEWHPTKNGDLTPDQVVAGSSKKAWWTCSVGPDHEWQASIVNRTKGRGCPMCRGLRASVTNSLASLYPDEAAQWHPTRN
ncbi:MAG: zinc-ribbon domain-containing protein, partial [Deltaproteobacteria bacterium]|nr:zinc-ribbon domain-containing protein [Deltaproteobacteria bacterium]